MADIDDPTKYREKFRKAKNRLASADIHTEDKRAIRSYIEQKETANTHTYSTLHNYTTTLTRAAELAHKPLVEWQGSDPSNGRYRADYTQFFAGLQEGELENAPDDGYSQNYCRSFKQNLKPFFRFLEREWSEHITVGKPASGNITEDDCFSSDETARLFQICDERDSAIVALMLATAQRASAVCSLELDAVDFPDEQRGRIKLNPEAIGLKGAEGWRPLIWATPYIKRWIDHHPRQGDPDAPLFCCKRNGAHYDLGDPIGYEALRRMIQTRCEQAEIPEEKAQIHRFKHTAIRRMIRDGLDEQRIKFMAGWHEDSSQLARYGSLKDKTHSEDIEAEYGLVDESDDEIGVSHENCPSCNTPLSELANPQYCPDCGLPLSHSAEETRQAMQEGTEDAIVEVDTEREAKIVQGILKELRDSPEEYLE